MAVRRLLENAAELETKDCWSRTPLVFAAKNGHEAVVELLLSRGDVVIGSRDRDGRTWLSYAAEKGHEAVVKLLLSRDDKQ